MNLANEGLEAKKKEEEVNAKNRKAEDDAQWEGQLLMRSPDSSLTIFCTANREQRVGSWRNFANSSKKKKKSKVAVLG